MVKFKLILMLIFLYSSVSHSIEFNTKLEKARYVVCSSSVVIGHTVDLLPMGFIGKLNKLDAVVNGTDCVFQDIEFEKLSSNNDLIVKAELLTNEIDLYLEGALQVKQVPTIANNWDGYFECWSDKAQLYRYYELKAKRLSRPQKRRLMTDSTDGGVICGAHIDMFKNMDVPRVTDNFKIYKNLKLNNNYENPDYLKVLLAKFDRELNSKLSLASLYDSYFDIYFSIIDKPKYFSNLHNIDALFIQSQKAHIESSADNDHGIDLNNFSPDLKNEKKEIEDHLKELTSAKK